MCGWIKLYADYKFIPRRTWGFGIGISKEWAQRSGINPVLYIQEDSNLSQAIEPFLINTQNEDKFNSIRTKKVVTRQEDDLIEIQDVYLGPRGIKIDAFNALLSFMKNSNGELLRKNKPPIPNYNFYSEREWRYCPSEQDWERIRTQSGLMMKVEYENWRNSSKEKKFIKGLELEFTFKDIDYIIVKNEGDISPMVKFLKDQTHIYKTEKQFNILITRIISTEKIKSDF